MLMTINYGLKKIELKDSPPDITVINPNWDFIDQMMKTLHDSTNTWDNFKASGGTIGTLTIEQAQSNVDGIITSKDLLGLYNKDSGVIFGSNIIHPAQVSQGKMLLGNNQLGFEDLWISAIGSVKANLKWRIVEVWGTTASSGITYVGYPNGTTKANCIMLGGYVIKSNGVANSINNSDYYYYASNMGFTAIEPGRTYGITFALKNY